MVEHPPPTGHSIQLSALLKGVVEVRILSGSLQLSTANPPMHLNKKRDRVACKSVCPGLPEQSVLREHNRQLTLIALLSPQ